MPNYPYDPLGAPLSLEELEKNNNTLLEIQSDIASVTSSTQKIVAEQNELVQSQLSQQRSEYTGRLDAQGNRLDNVVSEITEELKTEIITAGTVNRSFEPVSNFSQLAVVYPNPTVGDAVQTLDDNKIYRFDGTDWVFIEQFGNGPFTDVYNQIGELKVNNNDVLLYTFFKSPTDLSNMFFLSNDGENLVKVNSAPNNLSAQRDPSVAFFEGKFYVAHTGYNPHDFVISVSADLVTWTTQNISVGLGGSATVRVWAPELIVVNGTMYVLLSKQVGDEVDADGATIPSFRPYYSTLQNVEALTFSPAVALTLENSNKIDPTMIFHDSQFHIFIKDEFDKKIEQWSSVDLSTPFTKVSDNIPGMQFTEGCSVVNFKGKFYLYGDAYKSDRGITFFVTSTNLTSWSSKKQLKAGEKVRHGSAFKLTTDESKDILLKYRGSNENATLRKRDLLTPLGDLAVSNVISSLEIIDGMTYTASGTDKFTINAFTNPNGAKRFAFHISSNTTASITIANGSGIVGVVAGSVYDAAYGEGDMMIEFLFNEALNSFKPSITPLKKYTDKLHVGAKLGWKRVDFSTIGLTQTNLAVEDGVIYVLGGSSDATLSGVQSLPDGSRFGVAVFSGVAKLTVTSGSNLTVPGGSFVIGAVNNNSEAIIEFVKVPSSTFRLRK